MLKLFSLLIIVSFFISGLDRISSEINFTKNADGSGRNGFEKVMTDLFYCMLLLHDHVNLTFVSIVVTIPEQKLILIAK